MKEYDILVPLFYNDGTPVEETKLQDLQRRLIEQFEGLTFFPQPNQGFWKSAGVLYRDEIVVYRVISGNARTARRFLKMFKAELLRALEQEEILILERDVRTL